MCIKPFHKIVMWSFFAFILLFCTNNLHCADIESLVVKTTPVAYFEGSWFEIGRSIGTTYPEYITEFGKTMNTVLLFAGPGKGWTPQAYYDAIDHLIPQSIDDHLHGLAAGLAESRPISYRRAWELVLTQNVFTELLNMNTNMETVPEATEAMGCTGFAVSSEAGTFLCHNTDSTAGSGDNPVTAMYWHPLNDDFSYLTVDPPGWADVAYGLNEKGIAVTMNAGNRNLDAQPGLPVNYMVRSVMEKASTLEAAVECFRQHIDAGEHFGLAGAILHIVDFRNNSMVRIQVRSDTIDVSYADVTETGTEYIASANHYTGDFQPDPDYYYESSAKRYERLLTLIESTQTFDLEACIDILSDTNGGEASNTTISRNGTTSATIFSTVFTAGGMYCMLGPPHAYLSRFGAPKFISIKKLRNASVHSFTATPGNRRVSLYWQVSPETSIKGFHVYRASDQRGPFSPLTDTAIAADNNTLSYRYVDAAGLRNRQRYYYRLDVDNGTAVSVAYGPVNATPRLIY